MCSCSCVATCLLAILFDYVQLFLCGNMLTGNSLFKDVGIVDLFNVERNKRNRCREGYC